MKHRSVVTQFANILCVGALVFVAFGCAGSAQRKATMVEKAKLKDTTLTHDQLEELSNDFADRYYTLMLSASERVMRNNPDLQQRRIMNGLRLLGVSSMYDIASSSDTLTQLVNQLVVVTLQNYYWVDSGRSQRIWGTRAQFLVGNLRMAREDIWKIAARVFSQNQIEQLDLLISNWWYQQGGTEFVAYVRFSDVAAERGDTIVEDVRGGGGLLEPIDRATEQFQESNRAIGRTFFWTKRLPLFANWQILALAYDFLAMPETNQILNNINGVSNMVTTLPEQLASKGELAKELLAQYQQSLVVTGTLLDKVAPIATTVQGITQDAGTAVGRVNESLKLVQSLQAAAIASAKTQNAAAGAASAGTPEKPLELKDYQALLEQVRQNLVEANKLLGTTETLTDERRLKERLQPIENLVQMRIREVQAATNDIVNGIFINLAYLLGAVAIVGVGVWAWRRKQRAS